MAQALPIMAQVLPAVINIGISAKQTRLQNQALDVRNQALDVRNRAIDQRIAARDEQTRREVEEITRQQKREDEVAREKKSDRAREFDIQLGTLIASAADGGVTKAALARAGAAAGFIAGLDKARIESNRQEMQSQKRSRQVSIIEETVAANTADRSSQAENRLAQQGNNLAKKGNNLTFFGNAAGTMLDTAYSVSGSMTTSSSSVAPLPRRNYVGPQSGEGRFPASGEAGY